MISAYHDHQLIISQSSAKHQLNDTFIRSNKLIISLTRGTTTITPQAPGLAPHVPVPGRRAVALAGHGR